MAYSMTSVSLLSTLLVTFVFTSYAQKCGPPICKCVYGTSGLGIECSGPITTFDWKTLPSAAVTLAFNGVELGTSVPPIRALFSLRELRITNSTNVAAILNPAHARNLPNLKHLDLSSNSLTTFPSNVLAMMTSLTYLDLSANQITVLPSFSSMASLEDVLIGQNPVTSLPCTLFKGLKKLAMIELGHLKVTEIPACLFTGLKSLVKLSITRTEITTIPAGLFKDLTSLQHLELRHNQISTIPKGAFATLSNLIMLNLPGNYLTEVPDLTGLTKLEWLDLDDNLFSSVPEGAFGSLPALTELNFRKETLLTSVSSNAFTGLPSLTKIAVEDCIRLETLPDDVFVPLASSLEFLFISANGFTTIKEPWLDSLPKVFWLTITNNPLVCDCNLEWLHNAYITKKYPWSQGFPPDWVGSADFEAPRCYLPVNLRGKLFAELVDTDLKCSPPEVTSIVEEIVTITDGGVAHLQALVSGEYPKTTWETPGGKKVDPKPWTSFLPFPFNLTVLPSPSALKPPSSVNFSDPNWWRSIIPKPFDAFLPPLIPLPSEENPSAPMLAEAAAAPFMFTPPPFPFKQFIPPPFPFSNFIPSPFQSFIPPFPAISKMAEAAGPAGYAPPAFPFQQFIPPPFPYQQFIPPPFPFKNFIPSPFQNLIPPSFSYAKFVPTSVESPAKTPYLWVPPPGKQVEMETAGATAGATAEDKLPAPWMMFVPAPFRPFIPILPNGSFPVVPPNAGEADPGSSSFMAEAFGDDSSDGSSKLPTPWMMFVPAPFRPFIPILPNGSFPVVPPSPGGGAGPNTGPFMAEAIGDDISELPAPWMMFVPAPFRPFIPILPNGSFPFVPPSTGGGAGSFVAEAIGDDSSKLPAPWMMFVPAPFRAFIPILPNGSFPAVPSPKPIKMAEAGDDSSSADASNLPAPWMMFIPEPFRTLIPILPNGSFPFAATTPDDTKPGGTTFFPFKMAEAGGVDPSKLPAPWMMFVPEPFRTLIPILPNGSFPFAVATPDATMPGGKTPFFPFKMAEALGDDPSKLPAPWMMFIPEPFRTFIPILPNGSFPFAAPTPDDTKPAETPFFPFKIAEAAGDDPGKLPAPWMMFIPEPFRTFIPILPNGSFPFVPPSPGADSKNGAGAFKAFAVGADPGAPPDIPPSAWMKFIPEPFKVFIPLLPNGSFPVGALETFSAAAAVDSPFPWRSLIPGPLKTFVPIITKSGAPPESGPNDPVMWIAPSSATSPIPVYANGSFPWPPKPSNPPTNSGLPYPLSKTFKIPDFATPWLQFTPLPQMASFAVPTSPVDPSKWLDIIPNPFKYFIPRLPNGSFPWPATPKTPAEKTMASEARQPDGSVLASLSATEPGKYTLFVTNGDKTTVYSFNVKKASSTGKTAGVAIATIAGIAMVVLAIAIVVRRLRRNPKATGFNRLLSESAEQFSYSTI